MILERLFRPVAVAIFPLAAVGCIDGHHEPAHHAAPVHETHYQGHSFVRPEMPAHTPAHASRGHWEWDAHRSEWAWREEH